MKKILVYFLLLISLTSCFWNEEKIINNEKLENISNKNKEASYLVSTKWNEMTWDSLNKIWNSTQEILNDFYSDDKEKKEEIEKWLSNPKNIKTSEKWDVLEFLDFCESFSKFKTKEQIIDYIMSFEKEIWYDKIVDSSSFKNYVSWKKDYKKTNLDYKWYDYSLIHNYIVDKDVKSVNMALFSTSSIVSYYIWLIDYNTVISDLKIDWKKTYNHFFIDYITNNFEKEFSCKNFIQKNWYHKSAFKDD